MKPGDLIRPILIHKREGHNNLALVINVEHGIVHFMWPDGELDRCAQRRVEMISESR